MNRYKETVVNYLEKVAEDARVLVAATSDVAEGRVREARRRLVDALDDGRAVYDRARAQAARGVRAADEHVRENPYAPILAALLLGGLLAFLFTRRRE
jgi:ElaB/YqjD/DUF883 family membrane-anchored ribosome-binding protein